MVSLIGAKGRLRGLLRRAKKVLLTLAAFLLVLPGIESAQPGTGAAAAPPPPVTRAQFTVALAEQLHLQPDAGASPAFSDLPRTASSYGLIMAAYKAGWISGYPDGTFRPGASLTREQVAKCEILALGLQSEAAALADKQPAYGDAGSIGRWAWGYVNEAAAIGILRGFSPSAFGPQAVFTTAQIRHAQTQLAAYLARQPVQAFATPPAAAPGSAVGTTAIVVSPNSAGDQIAVAVSQNPLAAPTFDAALPAGASPYSPGANLQAAAGDYVGIYEADAAGAVVAFSQLQLAPGQIAQPPAQLSLSGPSSGTAAQGALIGPFTVQLLDANGNPAPAAAGGVSVLLSSDAPGAHDFSLTSGGPPATSLVIPPGSGSATFYYDAVTAGAENITATSPGLQTATLGLAVDGAAAARLSLSGPQGGLTGSTAVVGPFTVSLEDNFGNPTAAPAGGIQVDLASNSFASHEFSLSPSGTPVTAVTIPAGSNSATFYYGDAQAGYPTLTATAAGLGTAGAAVQLTADAAAAIALSGPGSGAVGPGASIGPFTVSLTDAVGNPVPAPPGGITVSLASTSPGSHEFASSTAGPPMQSVAIPAGSTSATFYYGDAQAGVPTISASAPGLPTATASLEVAGTASLVGSGLDSPATAVTPPQVQAWYDQGFRIILLNTFAPNFAQQYVASLAQLDVVLFQGYYTPAFTDETGAQRAQQAINAAQAVGYPKGAYIFVDVESTGGASQAQLVDWINSWSAAVQAAGYGAGVYFGVPQPLTAAQAGALIADRFWKSFSATSITPAVRGDCVIQTGYLNSMDLDTFTTDQLGEYCIGAGT